MRKKIVGSSWKTHVYSIYEGKRLAKEISEAVKGIEDVEMFILPTFPMIPLVAATLAGSTVKWGAQNISFAEKGAYTGEVPPQVLRELGCSYIEIGHAERRDYFNETNTTINKKVKLALNHGMRPIICTGETASDKDSNIGRIRLATEVMWALDGLDEGDLQKVIIAYEPIWAIGQTEAADENYVEDIHVFLRHRIGKEYGEDIAQKITIIYGGSVDPDNAPKLMSKENIDGLFVGRFGLKAQNFRKIVGAAVGK